MEYVTAVSQERGRSRSRSRSRSTSSSRQRRRTGSYGAGGGVVMVTRSRVPGYLRVKGTKAFQMTCQPFCLMIGQGTAASQGINWYGINGVPAAPTYVNSSIWSLGFTLGGVQTYINGTFVANAPNTNYAEYTALFDSYRIRKVEITMIYNSNSSSISGSPSLPVMSMANDYDDVNSTSLSSLQQYDSYRLVQFGNNTNNGKVLHRVSPMIGTVIETTGGSAIAGQNSNKTWIDCNNGTILYCGVKGNYDNMNQSSATLGYVTFYVKYFVEFKNTR